MRRSVREAVATRLRTDNERCEARVACGVCEGELLRTFGGNTYGTRRIRCIACKDNVLHFQRTDGSALCGERIYRMMIKTGIDDMLYHPPL